MKQIQNKKQRKNKASHYPHMIGVRVDAKTFEALQTYAKTNNVSLTEAIRMKLNVN